MAASDPTEPRVVELARQPTVAVRVQQTMAELDLAALFDRYLRTVLDAAASRGGVSAPPYGRYDEFDGPAEVDDLSRLRTEVYWPLG
jgi:hypothetical protein